MLLDIEKENNHEFVPFDSLWRVSVSQYHVMIESGALTEDNPIELLQGWLVQKMPKKPRHSAVTRIIRKLLADLIPDGWYIDSQEPITTDDSEPEPDIIVVQGNELDYVTKHPGPQDLGLVVEVSDATLSRDRTLKKRLYAQAGVMLYWIVNLPDNQIEVYSEPIVGVSGADYKQRQTYALGDSIAFKIRGEKIADIEVARLLPTE